MPILVPQESPGLIEHAAILEDAKKDTLHNRRWDPYTSGPLFRNELVRKEDEKGMWLVVSFRNDTNGKYCPTYSLVFCSQRQEFLDLQYEDVVSRKGFVDKRLAANILWPEEEEAEIRETLDSFHRHLTVSHQDKVANKELKYEDLVYYEDQAGVRLSSKNGRSHSVRTFKTREELLQCADEKVLVYTSLNQHPHPQPPLWISKKQAADVIWPQLQKEVEEAILTRSRWFLSNDSTCPSSPLTREDVVQGEDKDGVWIVLAQCRLAVDVYDLRIKYFRKSNDFMNFRFFGKVVSRKGLISMRRASKILWPNEQANDLEKNKMPHELGKELKKRGYVMSGTHGLEVPEEQKAPNLTTEEVEEITGRIRNSPSAMLWKIAWFNRADVVQKEQDGGVWVVTVPRKELIKHQLSVPLADGKRGLIHLPCLFISFFRNRKDFSKGTIKGDPGGDHVVVTSKGLVGWESAFKIVWPDAPDVVQPQVTKEKTVGMEKNPRSEVDLVPNCQEMVDPIRRALEFQTVFMKLLLVDEMPQKEVFLPESQKEVFLPEKSQKEVFLPEKLVKAKEAILAGMLSWPETWRPVHGFPPNVKGLEDIPLDDVFAGKADDWVFPFGVEPIVDLNHHPQCSLTRMDLLGREIREYHEHRRATGESEKDHKVEYKNVFQGIRNPCSEVDLTNETHWMSRLSMEKAAVLAKLHSWTETWRPIRGCLVGKYPEDIPLDDVFAGKADNWVFPIGTEKVGQAIGTLGWEIREYHEQRLAAEKLADAFAKKADRNHRGECKCPHCGGSKKIIDGEGAEWPCSCTFGKPEKKIPPLERTMADNEIAALSVRVGESVLSPHVTRLDGSVELRNAPEKELTESDVVGIQIRVSNGYAPQPWEKIRLSEIKARRYWIVDREQIQIKASEAIQKEEDTNFTSDVTGSASKRRMP